ncbi:MAG: hypothetical protein MJB14_13555 [Spirochaetes bacterium]|nr:hypothetical protein [Spirochaetota bacterium]
MKKKAEDHLEKFQESHSNIKFHYNRNDRLAHPYRHIKDEENCFFCRKNRILLMTFINILLIVIVAYVYLQLIGKAVKITSNGLEYSLSQRISKSTGNPEFILQLRNNFKSQSILENPVLTFMITNNNQDELIFQREIIVSKLTYQPKENFVEIIFSKSLPPGQYLAILGINPGIDLHLNFTIK